MKDTVESVQARMAKIEKAFATGKYPHSEMHYRIRMYQDQILLDKLKNEEVA